MTTKMQMPMPWRLGQPSTPDEFTYAGEVPVDLTVP